MTLSAAGNVGIGTTSPGSKLHIVDATNISAANSGVGQLSVEGLGYTLGIALDSTKAHIYHNSSLRNLSFGTNESVDMTIEGSTGNVGIGTTNPVGKFHSYISANRQIGHNAVGGDLGVISDNNSAPVLYVKGTGTADLVNIFDDTTEVFTILDGGNVGIGTTSPGAKLDVTTNHQAQTAIRVTHNNYNDYVLLKRRSDDTQKLGIKEENSNGSMGLFTADTTRVTITSAGNVGIGTTNPGEKLQVDSGNIKIEGGATSSIRGLIIAHTGQTGNQTLLVQNSTNSFGHLYTTERALRIEAGKDGGTGTGETLDFWVNGSERMMIDTSGNVGIGTTSPSTSLHVVKDASWEVARFEADSYPTATVYSQAAAKYAQLNIYDTRINSEPTMELRADTPHFNIRLDDTGNVLTIRDGGNVGIGTTSPGRQLELRGQGVVRLNGVSGGDPGIDFNTSDVNDMQIRYRSTTDALAIYSYGTSSDVLTIRKSDGNVGIGTTTISGQEGAANGTPKLQVLKTGTTGSYDLVARFGTNQDESNSGASVLINGGNDRGLLVSAGRADSNRAIAHLNLIQYDGNELTDGLTIYQPNTGSSGATSGTNIGIGTTSPSTKLQISGGNSSTPATALFSIQKNEEGYGLFSGVLGSGVSWMQSATKTQSTYYGLSLQPNGGNVGIGTTTPSNTLDVNGGAEINGETYIRSTSNVGLRIQTTDQGIGGNDGLRVGLNATHAFVWQYENKPLAFATNGGQRMTISAGGNVGIGTTSPDSLLQIGESYTTTSGTNKKIIANIGGYYSTAAGFQYQALGFTGTTFDESDISTQTSGEVLKNFYIGLFSDVGYFNENRFSIYQGGAERLSIKQSGNVGIGTTSPAQKLHVNDGGIRVERYATGLGGFISVGNGTEVAGNYSAYFFGNTNQDNAYFKGGIAYETLSSTNGRGDMHFLQNSEANGTNVDISDSVMTILNSGNVGIGTTSPVRPLHIHSASNTQMQFTDDGTGSNDTDGLRIGWNGSLGQMHLFENADLRFATNNSEKVRITSAGNVGIGTTSPGTTLDVDGTSRSDLHIFRSNQSAPTADAFIFRPADNTVSLGTANSERMRITSGGNVGIGTTSPAYKLDVNGTMRIAGNEDATNLRIAANLATVSGTAYQNYNELLFENTGATYGNAGIRHLGNAWFDSKSALAFFTSSNTGSFDERMRITSSGNVGIGTTSPGAPLDVQPASDYKVTKVGDDRTSHYKFTGFADHTLTLSSGSYHSSEVVITAHQTNGGTNNNLYIRGIWTNNHTAHHWHAIENIGGLSGSTFTITNGQSGSTTNSGELEIVHSYTNGSFGQMVVRVTDHYGTHSYTIS
jgi:hypothetical protein